MKIPMEIVTRHKIRDAKILSLYVQDALSMEEIAARFGIARQRVSQILYKNRHLLKIDQAYEKTKRINHLKRILSKKGDFCVEKDAVDLLKELRVETEGNKPQAVVHTGEIIHTVEVVDLNERIAKIKGTRWSVAQN